MESATTNKYRCEICSRLCDSDEEATRCEERGVRKQRYNTETWEDGDFVVLAIRKQNADGGERQGFMIRRILRAIPSPGNPHIWYPDYTVPDKVTYHSIQGVLSDKEVKNAVAE
jgi:hypothetical protein